MAIDNNLMIRSTSTAALSTALMLGGYCLMPKSSYSQVIPPPPILEGKNPITTKDQSKEPSIPGGLNQNSPAVGAKPSKNIGKDLKNSREQLFNKNHVFQVSNYKIICSESKLSQKRSLLNDRCIPLDPDQDIQTTTLGSLINKALKYSPQIKASKAKIKSQAATVQSQYSTWYPQLSISSGSLLYTNVINTQNYGSASDSTNPSASGTAFQPADPVSTSTSTSSDTEIVAPFTEYSSYTQAYPILTLEWKFLDFSRADTINAAKSELDATKLGLLADKRSVASQVIQLTGELISIENHISGLLVEYIAAQSIKKLYSDNVDQGYTSIDVLTAQESVVASLQYQIINLITQHQQYLAQLSLLTNQKQSNLFVVDYFANNSYWPYTTEETFELITQSPTIEQDIALSQQYKDLAAAARKDNLPNLSMLGYVSYVGTLGSTSYGPPEPPSGAWSSQLSNYIGVNLTWKIFDGFSNYNTASSYQANAEAIDFKRQQDILDAKDTAVKSLKLLSNAKAMKSSLSLALDSANDSLLVTLKRIQIGYENPTSTYASQQQISQALVQYSELYSSIVQSFAQLFVVTGVDPAEFFDSKL